MQAEPRLTRGYVECYNASEELLKHLRIPKRGGKECNVVCMISAYNIDPKQAIFYLELGEQMREKQLEQSMLDMGGNSANYCLLFCRCCWTAIGV